MKRLLLIATILLLVTACYPNGPGSPYISTEPAPRVQAPVVYRELPDESDVVALLEKFDYLEYTRESEGDCPGPLCIVFTDSRSSGTFAVYFQSDGLDAYIAYVPNDMSDEAMERSASVAARLERILGVTEEEFDCIQEVPLAEAQACGRAYTESWLEDDGFSVLVSR